METDRAQAPALPVAWPRIPPSPRSAPVSLTLLAPRPLRTQGSPPPSTLYPWGGAHRSASPLLLPRYVGANFASTLQGGSHHPHAPRCRAWNKASPA